MINGSTLIPATFSCDLYDNFEILIWILSGLETPFNAASKGPKSTPSYTAFEGLHEDPSYAALREPKEGPSYAALGELKEGPSYSVLGEPKEGHSYAALGKPKEGPSYATLDRSNIVTSYAVLEGPIKAPFHAAFEGPKEAPSYVILGGPTTIKEDPDYDVLEGPEPIYAALEGLSANSPNTHRVSQPHPYAVIGSPGTSQNNERGANYYTSLQKSTSPKGNGGLTSSVKTAPDQPNKYASSPLYCPLEKVHLYSALEDRKK